MMRSLTKILKQNLKTGILSLTIPKKDAKAEETKNYHWIEDKFISFDKF